jgi:hypothetical protein
MRFTHGRSPKKSKNKSSSAEALRTNKIFEYWPLTYCLLAVALDVPRKVIVFSIFFLVSSQSVIARAPISKRILYSAFRAAQGTN